MKRFVILIIPVVLALTPFLLSWNEQDRISAQKSIVVESGSIQENVISFGGDVLIKGRVTEDVVVFGGTVTVEGEIEQMLFCIGSKILLKDTSVINGDVVALGGELTKQPGNYILGDTIYFHSSADFFNALSGGFNFSFFPVYLLFKLTVSFIWLLLALVLIALLPRQIQFASSRLREDSGPALGIGLLAMMIYVGMTITAVFLSLLLIGLPILFVLIILGIGIKVFGQVIVYHFFGDSLARAAKKPASSPFLAVILGFLVVTLLGLVPLLGFVISFFLSLLGWGIVIRTKFGTTVNWFRKNG
jgi:hypothetical protein